jgi:beta-lactamase superfamily II metal-dependent hydrolase
MMEIHFFNVGCGNMTLWLFPNGSTWIYDCNITDDNEDAVMAYLRKALSGRQGIDAFICSHRDADHMRGIKKLHKAYPLGCILDNGVEGTTTHSTEYRQYMDLRRQLRHHEIIAGYSWNVDGVVVSWLHSKDPDYSNANDQSIVTKIDFYGSSVLFAGDTSYAPWKDKLVPKYRASLKSNILLASHHGSITFFDDPSDSRNYYTAHMQWIEPEMTLISVGPNVYGLPDQKAVDLYTNYSSGSSKGNKVYTTQQMGNMKVVLKGGGRCTLYIRQ